MNMNMKYEIPHQHTNILCALDNGKPLGKSKCATRLGYFDKRRWLCILDIMAHALCVLVPR